MTYLGIKKGRGRFIENSEAPLIFLLLKFLTANAKRMPMAYVYPNFFITYGVKLPNDKSLLIPSSVRLVNGKICRH